MSEKGCVFELSTEFKLWEDFLYSLVKGKVSTALLRRITKQILNVSVEHALNVKLVEYFKTELDLSNAVIDIIEEIAPEGLDREALAEMEDFLYDIKHQVTARLTEMFHDVDMGYALWSTKQLSNTITLVEYLGDFRILEWHERSGIPYQGLSDVRYEFSVAFLRNQLNSSLTKYRGKYAGNYLGKCLDVLVRSVIEEMVFLEGNKQPATTANAASAALGKLTLQDFTFTREKIKDYFPLMTEQDIDSVLVDVETAVKEDMLTVMAAVVKIEEVKSWFINDTVLTVIVDKPMTKVDFGERLKNDIKASIANGDWVPPKLRNLADM